MEKKGQSHSLTNYSVIWLTSSDNIMPLDIGDTLTLSQGSSLFTRGTRKTILPKILITSPTESESGFTKLSVLWLFHVGQVVHSSCTFSRLLFMNGFHVRIDWNISCCRLVLSSKPHIWKFQVVTWLTMSKKLHQKACCMCSTIIFPHSTNQISDLQHFCCHCCCIFFNSLISDWLWANWNRNNYRIEINCKKGENLRM